MDHTTYHTYRHIANDQSEITGYKADLQVGKKIILFLVQKTFYPIMRTPERNQATLILHCFLSLF